ncbi:MAG: hypothetical protein AB1611_02240 [bacterium]
MDQISSHVLSRKVMLSIWGILIESSLPLVLLVSSLIISFVLSLLFL